MREVVLHVQLQPLVKRNCPMSRAAPLSFAIEQANPGETCAVWAIDQQWMYDALKRNKTTAVRRAFRLDRRLKSPEAIRVLVEEEPSLVAPLVPYYINERLAVQQGVFLVPMNLNRSFMENLRALATPKTLRRRVLKIEIPVTVEKSVVPARLA
jgi:hypothetical protein